MATSWRSSPAHRTRTLTFPPIPFIRQHRKKKKAFTCGRNLAGNFIWRTTPTAFCLVRPSHQRFCTPLARARNGVVDQPRPRYTRQKKNRFFFPVRASSVLFFPSNTKSLGFGQFPPATTHLCFRTALSEVSNSLPVRHFPRQIYNHHSGGPAFRLLAAPSPGNEHQPRPAIFFALSG